MMPRSCIDAWHRFASVAQCVARRREPVYALGRVFASRLCHSGQTHRFRRCSVAAAGAFEYPKTNSRNGNKVKLLLLLLGKTHLMTN